MAADIRKAGQDVQRYLYDQAYGITLATVNTVYGVSPKVGDWRMSVLPQSLDLNRLVASP